VDTSAEQHLKRFGQDAVMAGRLPQAGKVERPGFDKASGGVSCLAVHHLINFAGHETIQAPLQKTASRAA
jgi:hypothetical protein